MSATFSRTLRSLDADRSRRRTLGLLFAAALVAGWIAWFVLGRVGVYEFSDRARLEVHRAAHPVAAPVAGRVVTTRLRLGKTVREGQVVVEIDSERQRLALEEAKVRLEGVRQRLAAVQAEVQAEEEGLRAHEEASQVAVEASRARERLETLATLHGEGIESRERLKEAEAEAEAEDAALNALRLGTDRLERERRVAGTDRRARLA